MHRGSREATLACMLPSYCATRLEGNREAAVVAGGKVRCKQNANRFQVDAIRKWGSCTDRKCSWGSISIHNAPLSQPWTEAFCLEMKPDSRFTSPILSVAMEFSCVFPRLFHRFCTCTVAVEACCVLYSLCGCLVFHIWFPFGKFKTAYQQIWHKHVSSPNPPAKVLVWFYSIQ